MRRIHRKSSVKLVEPSHPEVSGDGMPPWMGHAFGLGLILGDFFLGRPLVDSFDAFSGPGLPAFLDPFAVVMAVGVLGWWLVVVGLRRTWVGGRDPRAPVSAGVGVTALVMALVTAVGIAAGLAQVVPALAIERDGAANPLGIGLVTALLIGLAGAQWWLLSPHPSDPESGSPDGEPSPGPREDPAFGPHAASTERVPPRVPDQAGRPGAPGLRLVAALLLLPAGWALMAPADLLVQRAEEGIRSNWPSPAGSLGVAALFSLFSAGVGLYLAYGPRALAARILGTGPSGRSFFLGLCLAHWVRLSLALLGV